MGSISPLAKGKIEKSEAFYLMAKVRTDQSASLLNGVNSSTGYDTLYFVCMNKLQETNKNLFYLSCDPEDYMVNRLGSSNANGAVEFFYEHAPNAMHGTYHFNYKNNLHHNTGHIQSNTFTGQHESYSSPPGIQITLKPSKEYDIPIENYQGPAYSLTIGSGQVNFYFRKNTSQTGVKKTFDPLVELTSASPKFISLNRSYVQLAVSDYTVTDEGFTIDSSTNADKVNQLRNGILQDSAGNYFEYLIVKGSSDVKILGLSKWNSTTADTAIDKTGNIFFILSSDFDNSFSNLETLVGDNYSSKIQYLDFFMLKKNSYGTGLNKYVGHGLNTASSDDRFYSAHSGQLCNPHSYGVLIHFLLAYVDTAKTTTANYASIKSNARNNAPAQPHVLFTNLHDSALEIPYDYAKQGDNSGMKLGTKPDSDHGGKQTIASVSASNSDGEIFNYNQSEYEYNKTMDYIYLGILVVSGIILLTTIIVYLIKLYDKDDKDQSASETEVIKPSVQETSM